ncbi:MULTISPECIES: GNAT family N-acetyltransferase [Pseudomonas]|uniref:GNAT family N-acetyltransferase n=1 Tax=Pseudomonas TaxID=286 RepID=UPI001BCDCC4D|nr:MULTISPECIES: GNAT family N-acetyltransferase [Pseudomonas]MBS7600621.1 GNAT family N-acetyltransferase [Pseudomonas sp. RC2C2]UVL26376.1 GNAT family N-acetyltransferase [Pseudomonas donghuensis]
MDLSLAGQQFSLLEHFKDDTRLRASFNALTHQTFEFDFEQWYQDGYWGEGYQPCALAHDGRIVANISVNLMHFDVRGERKRCIQLGTVMVAPEYQGKGLSRVLLERVLDRWRGQCDLLYLFANDTVLDYYPKFGFERVLEHQYSVALTPSAQPCSFHKVDMDDLLERQRFIHAVDCAVPAARLAMCSNHDQTMFYCTSFFKECVHYSAALQAYVVMEVADGVMTLYDVFARQALDLQTLIAQLCTPQTTRVVLGFAPLDVSGFEAQPLESDDSLFVLGQAGRFIEDARLMFALLSHA